MVTGLPSYRVTSWDRRAKRVVRGPAPAPVAAFRSVGLVVLLSALVLTGCASSRRWGSLVVADVREAGHSVASATPRQWGTAAAVAGGIAAASLLDERVQQNVAESNSDSAAGRFFDNIEPFGGRYSDRLLGGFLIGGLALRDDRMKAVAFDGFVSAVASTKVIVPVLKNVAGRDRPSAGEGAYSFGGGSSFPSSHATQAFAVATVIAEHYPQRWIDVTAYGVATAVGYARMRHDAHWFSDVLAGAVIGHSVAKFVVHTNERERAKWSVVPTARGAVVRVEW